MYNRIKNDFFIVREIFSNKYYLCEKPFSPSAENTLLLLFIAERK